MRHVQNAQRVISPTGLVGDLYGIADERAPLVLLHGLSFDRRIWDPVLTDLAQVDPQRRVLALDLPGHGESADPWSWEMQRAIESLHAMVVEHCLENPVLVGHSAGAILATAYAAQLGTRGVINVDCVLEATGFATFLRSAEAALRGPNFDAVWQSLAAGFGTELLPRDMQARVRLYGPPRQEVALGFWNELMVQTVEQSEADRLALLRAVSATGLPYQVVHGLPLPRAYERWLNAALPGVLCEVIQGGGHFPMLADPARFAAILADSGVWSRQSRRAS